MPKKRVARSKELDRTLLNMIDIIASSIKMTPKLRAQYLAERAIAVMLVYDVEGPIQVELGDNPEDPDAPF